MQTLYSEKDLQDLGGQLRRRFLVVGLAAALFLAVAVWSFIRRIEWLSVAGTILCGFVLVFGIDLFCLPLIRYRSLVASALRGRKHTETFEYGETEPDLSRVDGISCRSILVLGEADKHGTRAHKRFGRARRGRDRATRGDGTG